MNTSLLQANIVLVGTTHSLFSETVSLMDPRLVPTFIRSYEEQLKRADTLLLLEGDGDRHGNGMFMHFYKSRSYHELLKMAFGETYPSWIRCTIAIADKRDLAYHFSLESAIKRILPGINVSDSYRLDTNLPRDFAQKASETQTMSKEKFFEGIEELKGKGVSIDFEIMAQVFGHKSSVRYVKERVLKPLLDECNNPMKAAIEQWRTGYFRNIISLSGAAHAYSLHKENGYAYHEILPETFEVSESFLEKVSMQQLGAALHASSLLFCDQFYETLEEMCAG